MNIDTSIMKIHTKIRTSSSTIRHTDINTTRILTSILQIAMLIKYYC